MKYLNRQERVARIAAVLYGLLGLLFLWRFFYVSTQTIFLTFVLNTLFCLYYANEWRIQIKEPLERRRNFTGRIVKKYFALNEGKKQFYFSVFIEELGVLKQVRVNEYVYYGDKVGDRIARYFYSKDLGKSWLLEW